MFCIKVWGKVHINNCQQLSDLSKKSRLKRANLGLSIKLNYLFFRNEKGNAYIQILPTERVNLTLKGCKIQLKGIHVGTKD